MRNILFSLDSRRNAMLRGMGDGSMSTDKVFYDYLQIQVLSYYLNCGH